ncbi:hypothetical protein [uncultured Brevundimonas sp.]|uniref:hypothetical protein n=1 Tax=uncultured Brevundimonas sp. TaxID=213418 RepID=UPI0025FED40E|nr:hypothetical protein [uncultured Brevundimonas sp.]
MTVFGRTLETQEIVALVGLLLTLTLWLMAWRGERNWATWFKGWEAERKARRDAEIRAESGEPEATRPGSGPGPKSGPWG